MGASHIRCSRDGKFMAKEQIKGPSENEIQAAFFSWLALHEKKYPELGLFYAIPNGSHKSPAARGLFKRTGLKAGVPDVHLPVRCKQCAPACIGLWIEFKTAKRKMSQTQIDWVVKLSQYGHGVELCRSWAEAANITIDYLALPLKKLEG